MAKNSLKNVQREIEKGLAVCHCTKCGCMRGSLQNVYRYVTSCEGEFPSDFESKLKAYLSRLENTESN
jgi:hypothetical protein